MLEVVSTVSHYVVHILLTTAAAILLYIAAKGAKKLFMAYQEVFVMCTIAFGRRWMPKSKGLRIQPFFCRTAELDEDSVNECFRFHAEAFAVPENTSQQKALRMYDKVLRSYSHILFCRDRLDGSLRGLMLLGVDRKETYTVFKLGLMLFHRHYRGGPWMRLAIACMILRELILHPRTPLYIIGKSSTYKSYLITSQFPGCHPYPGREIPELFKKIAEDYVNSMKLPSEDFNRDTLVLKRRVGLIREHVAPISERDLANTHIKFFNDHNPGWRQGDQMVVLAKLTWSIWINNLLRISLKQFRPSKLSTSTPQGLTSTGNVDYKKASRLATKRRFFRGTSFQDIEANLVSMKFYTYELGDDDDGVPLSPQSRKPFRVDRIYSQEPEEDLNVDFSL